MKTTSKQSHFRISPIIIMQNTAAASSLSIGFQKISMQKHFSCEITLLNLFIGIPSRCRIIDDEF